MWTSLFFGTAEKVLTILAGINDKFTKEKSRQDKADRIAHVRAILNKLRDRKTKLNNDSQKS